MLSGSSPFHGDDEEELFENIRMCNYKFSVFLSQESKLLIRGLLEKDTRNRLGMTFYQRDTLGAYLLVL